MNYLESLRYLKQYPPDILSALGKFAKGAFLPHPDYENPIIMASDLGTTPSALVKMRGISPIVRSKLSMQMKQDEKDRQEILDRDEMISNFEKFNQWKQSKKFRGQSGPLNLLGSK